MPAAAGEGIFESEGGASIERLWKIGALVSKEIRAVILKEINP